MNNLETTLYRIALASAERIRELEEERKDLLLLNNLANSRITELERDNKTVLDLLKLIWDDMNVFTPPHPDVICELEYYADSWGWK